MGDNCCSVATENVKKEVEGIDIKPYVPAIISFVLLVAGMIWKSRVGEGGILLLLVFLVAYSIVGWKTIWKAIKSIPSFDIFNEFFLMTIATVGAFAIGEYEEGVAVMLFYEVGELFNGAAVKKARKSVKALLDIRPEVVTVIRENDTNTMSPQKVLIGEVIQTKPGERVALDGELLSDNASFNTSALTGESVPKTIVKGEKVLAGMINLNSVSEIKVTAKYENSSLAKILDLVQHALARKANTELFIRKFAKVYTPIVVFLALGITFLPYFFTATYQFEDWLYRGLVFLVISCPCALVISIPLGYFGGIGAASKNGILFKGSNFLDQMTQIDTVVLDKTGTVTKGIFKVQKVKVDNFDIREFIKLTAAIESQSTHPIARAIVEFYKGNLRGIEVKSVEEVPGLGLVGQIGENKVLAGNIGLLKKFNISYNKEVDEIVETTVVVAINGEYRGYITIADEIKEDAKDAIRDLKKLGIKKVIMLSGDKDTITKEVGSFLSLDEARGGLLPEDKVKSLEALKAQGRSVAFVGDGLNDAPVIALADVGIAMGGLGSDATIETADVVIQTDQPSKIATAIRIAKATRGVVWQNIVLAFGVKIIVLTLGAWGVASLWEAVFADVGVALLAILNAIRIQRMNFSEQ